MNIEKILKDKRVLLAGVGIVVVIVLIILFNQTGQVNHFTNLPLDGDYTNVVVNSKEVFLLKDKQIARYSEDGKELSRINLPVEGGKMVGDDKTILYFFNENIYFLDKSGKIKASAKLNFPVEECKLSGDKLLALGRSSYSLLDTKGNVLKTSLVRGRVITCDLNSDKALITSIEKKDETSNDVNSFLTLLDLNSMEQRVLTFPHEVIFYNKAMDKERVLTVSNVEARVMKDENILGKKKVLDFKSAGFNNGKIYILEEDKLGVYDEDLKNEKKMELKGDFSSLAISKDKVLLYNTKGFAQYKNGVVDEFINTKDIYNGIVTPGNIYFIHSDSISVE